MRSSTAHRCGAVPVRSATLATAIAMPTPKHMRNDGNQLVCRKTDRRPGRICDSQPRLIPKPTASTIATVRTGRHERFTSGTATRGSSR